MNERRGRGPQTERNRVAFLIFFGAVVMGLFVLRLVSLQIMNGQEYLEKASSTYTYRFDITAARGDVVDRYGRSLATNTAGYNVVINNVMRGDADLNALLQQLVAIMEKEGEPWNDTMLVSEADERGSYSFTARPESESEQNRVATLKEALGLQQYATADNVMARIVEEFKLESYDPHWQRVLGGIRYQMRLEDFSNNNNFTFATNVSINTMATVKERSLSLPGVEIVETALRSYPDGTLLPHVLGSVGKITREQWVADDYALRSEGYRMSDLIGQSGLESLYEAELRGEDGEKEIVCNADGEILSTQVTEEPVPGQTVVLTVDKDFQQKVNQIVESNILRMRSENAENKGKEATAGAAVVIDVKNGGILASANYPSYDLNLYSSHYSEYASDEALPLYNRAFQGLYSPGSTFKPAVAAAGLIGGLVTERDKIACYNPYSFYTDYTPRCLQHGHKGPINVVDALRYSCNIYFYDVGRRLGIDKYDEMAYRLGLAGKTGLEVNEATGQLTTQEDENYGKGLELQAAIGQGNTLVSPVQLATYAATLANNGTRYRTHLVAGLQDTNTGEMVYEVQPEILEQIEDTNGAFETIRQGMIGA
ncbi:MAG: peptidase, partial [Oscillospiraceae bacterium]|nr:peptidase [Oscillospiraceae bacterium]